MPGPHGALRVAVALSCAFALALAGCTGDEGETGAPEPGTDAETGCDTRSGAQRGQTFATVLCEGVEGAALAAQSFDCQDPSRSEVRVGDQLTEGSYTVRVEDGANETIFQRTYDEAGRSNDTATLTDGEPGNWTVTAERDASFAGSFGVQVACAGEVESGCRSDAGQQNGTDFARLVCREIEGADRHEQPYRCEVPRDGQIRVQTDLTAGRVTVRLIDDAGETAYERTFQGSEEVREGVGGGQAGGWTLVAERSQGVEGTFGAQATCPAQ